MKNIIKGIKWVPFIIGALGGHLFFQYILKRGKPAGGPYTSEGILRGQAMGLTSSGENLV